MFDILVDTPRKRLGWFLLLMIFLVVVSLTFDLVFCVKILKTPDYASLLNGDWHEAQSFFSCFYYELTSSFPLLEARPVSTITKLILRSFSFFDWILMVGLWGMILSHRAHLTRLTLCYLGGYFVSSLVLSLFGAGYLLKAVFANSASLFLSRVHILAGVLAAFCVIYIVIGIVWGIRVWKRTLREES